MPLLRNIQKTSGISEPSAAIECRIETPPVMFIGEAANSAGALITGQMFLNTSKPLKVESFKVSLRLRTRQARPYQKKCSECADQVTVLEKWAMISRRTALETGRHGYPFSCLLGGDLPISMDTSLVSIKYELEAVAVTSAGTLTFVEDVPVRRSLDRPNAAHRSIRTFSTFAMTTSVRMNRIVEPSEPQLVQLQIHRAKPVKIKGVLVSWELRKVAWKLEENITTRALACFRHAPPGNPATPNGDQDSEPSLQRSETRVLDEACLYSGWQAQAATESLIGFDFHYGPVAKTSRSRGEERWGSYFSSPRLHAPYTCDCRAEGVGVEVSHTLALQVILTRDLPSPRPDGLPEDFHDHCILEGKYPVVLTEHRKEAVSWDKELPPLYWEVPETPPGY